MLLGRRFDVIVGSDLQVDYELRLRGFASEVVKAAYRPAKTTPLYFGIYMSESADRELLEGLADTIYEVIAPKEAKDETYARAIRAVVEA